MCKGIGRLGQSCPLDLLLRRRGLVEQPAVGEALVQLEVQPLRLRLRPRRRDHLVVRIGRRLGRGHAWRWLDGDDVGPNAQQREAVAERGRRGRERRQKRRREAPQHSVSAIGSDARTRARNNADRSPSARGRARARSSVERAIPGRPERNPARHARRWAPPRRVRHEDCGRSTAMAVRVSRRSCTAHVSDRHFYFAWHDTWRYEINAL